VFPISDTVVRRHVPWMTLVLIVANVTAFVVMIGRGEAGVARVVQRLALVPARDLPAVQLPAELLSGGWLPWVGHMFLHGGWMHLLGNVWTLWLFGDNVEDRMGPIRFLVFYLLCGWAAAALHVLSAPDSPLPVVGASGAISGVMGAYLVMFPRARIHVLFVLLVFVRIVAITAWVYLGLWFWMQVMAGTATLGRPEDGGVAFWAHIGGFVAGVLLHWLFVRRDRRPARGEVYQELRGRVASS
jgi:membrane associated rhomboid family serine protease